MGVDVKGAFDLSGRVALVTGASSWGIGSAAAEALAEAGATAFATRRLDAISSGERRRLALACALATEAPVLLLDEPTVHLDAAAETAFYACLLKSPRTFVMSGHANSLPAGFFTRVVRLEEGRIVSDEKLS